MEKHLKQMEGLSWKSFYISFLHVYLSLISLWLLLKFTVKIPVVTFLLEILISNSTLILISPLIVPVLLVNFLVRLVLSNFAVGPKFKLMNGIDAVWAPTYPATVPNFTSLYVIQGKCDLEKIRKRLDLVMKHPNFVRLRQRVTCKFGYYCWEDMSAAWDINKHVKILSGCEDLRKTFTESETFSKIENVYDDFFPGDVPQWEILVVPNYRYDNQKDDKPHYCLVYRMHHSILDGVSAGLYLQYGLADYPVKGCVDPLKPLGISPFVKILAYVMIFLTGARSLAISLTTKEKNCFHGKKMTGPKHLGWSRPIDLKVLKKLKTVTKTSTTAILISSFGGALRSLAKKKKCSVPKSINAAATVAMLPYPNAIFQNRFTSAHVPIEIGLETSKERLMSAFKHATNMARSPDVLVNFHMMQLVGSFPAVVVDDVMKNASATMLLSNVPGPAEDVYVFGGDKLIDAVAWGPFKGLTAIGMLLFSYGNTVRAAVVADDVALPNAGDIKDLLASFEEEIMELAESNQLTSSCFADS